VSFTDQRRVEGAPAGRAGFPRLRAWALLVALIPSLAFFGHWTPRLPIPGTSLYVGLPVSTVHDHGQAGSDHESHCHTDSSACSDVPFTGVSAFALLSQTVTLLGAAATMVALSTIAWRPGRIQTLSPEPRPPRRPAAAFA